MSISIKGIYIKYALLAVALLMLITPISYTLRVHDVWISFILFFFLALFLFNRNGADTRNALFALLAGILTLDIPVRLIEGIGNTNVSLPRLIMELLGCYLAYLFYKKKNIWIRISVGLLLIAFPFVYVNLLYKYWFNYVNYNTFTGQVDKKNVEKFTLLKGDGKTSSNVDYTTKIVIFDFWNTSCAVCYRKFPELERLYKKYQNDTNIIIQSVDIPLSRDSMGMAEAIIKSKHYTFPVVIGSDNSIQVFGIMSYPTVIILDHNNLVFRGDIYDVDKFLHEVIKPVIE